MTVITRTRPPAAPAPRTTTAKPADPTALVVRALGAGADDRKTASDLIEVTRLPRGTVVSTIAALASEGRLSRSVGERDGALVGVVGSEAVTGLTREQEEFIGLRPAIVQADGAPIRTNKRIFGGPRPVATDSPLDVLIRTTTDRKALARELLRLIIKPGRSSVMTASHLITATPNVVMIDTLRGRAKVAMPKATWATLLAIAWVGRSAYVAQAAEGDLRHWFNRADLLRPPVFLKHLLYSADELPETLRLYRGGSSASDLLRVGYSWSPHEDTAAAYATDRVCTYGGHPVVLTAEVPTGRLVMATRTSESEFVTLDHHSAEEHLTDPRAIRRLADKYMSRQTKEVMTQIP